MSRALLLLLGLACSPSTREAASSSPTASIAQAAQGAGLEEWTALRKDLGAHEKTTSPRSADATRALHARVVTLAERHAGSPAAIPILVERARLAALLDRAGVKEMAQERDRALETLLSGHVGQGALGVACETIGACAVDDLGVDVAETFLTSVIAKTTLPEVKAGAEFGLARARHDAIDALPAETATLVRTSLSALAARTPPDRRARAAADLLHACDHLRVMRSPPEIDARDVSGAPLRMADFAGRVVLIVFWSELDAVTREALTAHSKRTVELAQRPFTLVTVHANDDPSVDEALPAELREFVEAHGRVVPSERASLAPALQAAHARLDELDRARTRALLADHAYAGRHVVDGSSAGPWSRRWDVRRRPATFLVDAQGRLRFRDLPADELDLSIAMLLREAEADGPTKR